MVEEVLEVCAKLDGYVFSDGNPFYNAHIDIVNRRQLHGIATIVRESAELGHNILRVWVLRQIANQEWTRCCAAARGSHRESTGAECSNVAARARHALGVEDNAVAGGVAVQVGVDTALDVGPLTHFIGINGSDLPVANHILHEPIGMPVPGSIVNRCESEAVAMIEGRV